MRIEEYQKIKSLDYFEYCDYLQGKYGLAPCDYMTKGWNKRVQVSRTVEGLYVHHKYENKAIMLSSKEYAQHHPREWQNAENLVYCDLLEHMLLHILICELPPDKTASPTEAKEVVGIGAVTNYIVPELNDVYSGRIANRPWEQRCHQQIIDDRDAYILLLQRFQKSSSCSPTSFLKSASAGYGSWPRSNNAKIYNEILSVFNVDKKELYDWFTNLIWIELIRKGYSVEVRHPNYTFVAEKDSKRAYIKFTLHSPDKGSTYRGNNLVDMIKGNRKYMVSLDPISPVGNEILCCNVWDFLTMDNWV